MPPLTQHREEIEKAFVEQGANLEHDRWSRWQAYMFSKGIKNPDGSVLIPAEFADRWFRQINTPYSKLSEPEKESDRKETRNYLPLLSNAWHFISLATLERVREDIPKEMTMAPALFAGSKAGAGYTIGYNRAISDILSSLAEIEKETCAIQGGECTAVPLEGRVPVVLDCTKERCTHALHTVVAGKRFLHNFLGWGFPYREIGRDYLKGNFSCQFCQGEITKDSQGNWFHLSEKL